MTKKKKEKVMICVCVGVCLELVNMILKDSGELHTVWHALLWTIPGYQTEPVRLYHACMTSEGYPDKQVLSRFSSPAMTPIYIMY